MKGIKVGDFVREQYGDKGSIVKEYDNFFAIKMSGEYSHIEWLEEQIIPFNSQELKEKWYEVHLVKGGSIWSPESRLYVISNFNVSDLL